jgi:hypothetical protein
MRKRRPIIRGTSVNFPQNKARCHHHAFATRLIPLAYSGKMKLDMQIEAILKLKKGNRTKRKKKVAD